MRKKTALALVVSDPGSLQNGLMALMTTTPQINTVLAAENLQSALSLAKRHQPQLTVLDLTWPEIRDAIKGIKTQCPFTHLIALVEDFNQKKELKSWGADRVLVKGFPAQKMIKTIEDLIDQGED